MSWKTVTIDVDADEIIDKIPTKILEEELNKRKELIKTNPKSAELEEKWRCDVIGYDIDPDSYDLIEQENVSLNNFDDYELISYLESNGYSVYENGYYPTDNLPLESVAKFLQNSQKHKVKDFLCDLLCFSHMANNNEVINGLKNLL